LVEDGVKRHLDQTFAENPFFHDDLVLYIRASPETCLARVRLRNHSNDQRVTLDELRAIHERHERVFVAEPPAHYRNKVLVIDGDRPLAPVVDDVALTLRKETRGLCDRLVAGDSTERHEVYGAPDLIHRGHLRKIIAEIRRERRPDPSPV
jgi:hypothetical protein